MPFAVSVKSANATADAILSLWDQVGLFEDSPSMRALNYPPHITFAIYDAPAVTEELAIAAMKGRAGIRAGAREVGLGCGAGGDGALGRDRGVDRAGDANLADGVDQHLVADCFPIDGSAGLTPAARLRVRVHPGRD